MHRYFVALAVMSAHAVAFQNVSQPGAIEGIVLDEQGKPVSGVTVSCRLVLPDHMARHGVLPSALTGQDPGRT
jgi:hypothetical protein